MATGHALLGAGVLQCFEAPVRACWGGGERVDVSPGPT